MTWTRLGDGFNDRPDLNECSRSARLLHVEALVWCNKHLTDGRIPFDVLGRASDSEDIGADLKELADAGIWTASEDGKAWLLDWSDQEPSEDVKARQRRQADKQKRYRRRKELHADGDHSECDPRYCKKAVTGNATSNATSNTTSNETGLVTPSRPVPSRPLGRDRDRGAGPDLPRGRSALPPDRDEDCIHRPDGLTWAALGHLKCETCHRFGHVHDTAGQQAVYMTTETVIDRAMQWPRHSTAEIDAILRVDNSGYQLAQSIAKSVERRHRNKLTDAIGEPGSTGHATFHLQLTSLIYRNVNYGVWRLHEFLPDPDTDELDDCVTCNLPKSNPIHVGQEDQ